MQALSDLLIVPNVGSIEFLAVLSAIGLTNEDISFEQLSPEVLFPWRIVELEG